MTDWRNALLDGITLVPGSLDGTDPLDWPGYAPRCAVNWGHGRFPAPAGTTEAVACVWDFSTYGGSFGIAETNALVAAVDAAISADVPLVTWARTGGTRLQEGMAALVCIPRALIALRRLAAARLPHIAVADHPTTGGVWVGVTSGADLRVGISRATVGFSGPRVVESVTGVPLPPGENTAESAYASGLLDAVVAPEELRSWLARALGAVTGRVAPGVDGSGVDGSGVPPVAMPGRSGWEQVQACRTGDRPDGTLIIDALLDDAVDLHGTDPAVRAAVGLLGDRSTVAVALASRRGGRPRPDGYALAVRATELASRMGWPLITLVDTPGADPSPPSEHAGIAAGIGALMDAVLRCSAPTLALVHGEGGSGGALAAAVTDRILVSPLAYFSAIAPEGAAQALKTDPRTAAELGGLVPERLVALGVADGLHPVDAAGARDTVLKHMAELAAQDAAGRLEARAHRWASGRDGH